MADVISAKILERFTAFSEAFIPFDGNHTGAITRQHIEQGLLSKGFDMSKTSVDSICNRFSSASNPALVDYWALSTHLKNALSLSRGKQTGAIEEELRVKLDEHFRSFQHAFLCFDSERSGTVDLKNFTDVLKRFGICLSDSEVEELKREAAAAMAAEAQIVPARKKRDVIFGGEEEPQGDDGASVAVPSSSKRIAIKYSNFIEHFRRVLRPQPKQKKVVAVHAKRGKNVGHNAGHKIFGTKATALEGKQAQKTLARGMFVGLHLFQDMFIYPSSPRAENH